MTGAGAFAVFEKRFGAVAESPGPAARLPVKRPLRTKIPGSLLRKAAFLRAMMGKAAFPGAIVGEAAFPGSVVRKTFFPRSMKIPFAVMMAAERRTERF